MRMMKRSIAMVAMAGLALAPVPALAQLVTWGQADVWDVLVDPGMGNGCMIQADFEDGSFVRIGIDVNADQGYVHMVNDAWGGIKDGGDYPIVIDFDGTQYDASATGAYLDGSPGALVTFTDENFLVFVAQSAAMVIYADNGEEVLNVSLAGTEKAVPEMLSCQEAQG